MKNTGTLKKTKQTIKTACDVFFKNKLNIANQYSTQYFYREK